MRDLPPNDLVKKSKFIQATPSLHTMDSETHGLETAHTSARLHKEIFDNLIPYIPNSRLLISRVRRQLPLVRQRSAMDLE